MATLLQRQFSNRVYWEKREREARENYLQTEAQEVAEIERIYRGMAQWAEDEINRFYGKYAGLEGIDIAEAKKRVTKLDIEQYQELAKKYVADRNFSDKASEELRLYNATMRINRLEMLNARIGLDLVAGIDEIDKYCGDKMTERAEAEFRRLAGILGETIDYKDMEKQAKAIVNASFKNATYSERLWSHMGRLRSEINIELQRGLIAGISSREMARRIAVLSNDYTSNYSKSLRDAERLMVTELRRVQTDVAMQTYKAEGITQYMYMAVNPRACEACRAINGKIYNVKEGEVGLNLPPMHPRCHCTTAPWQDPAEYEAWLNWLESGGTTKEWEALPAEDRRRLIETAQDLVEEQATETVSAQSIDDCTTTQDVEDLINSKNWFYKDPRADTRTQLTGCDLESAKSVYRSIETVFNKYPKLIGELNPVGIGEKRKNVYASCWFGLNGRGGVNLNTKYYGNYKKFTESYLSSTKQTEMPELAYMGTVIRPKTTMPSFHPANTTAEAVVIHEFGHALDDYMTKILKLNGKDKTYSTRLKRSVLKAAGVKNADVNSEVSVYATENTKEFFAECFAEYLNSPTPRRVAAEFGKLLDEELKANGKL